MRRFFILAIVTLFLFSGAVSAEAEMDKEDKAKYGLAQSLVSAGRYDEAMELVEELYGRYPEDRDINLVLAQTLGYDLKLNEAIEIITGLEERFPKDYKIRYIHANILEANQRFSEARKFYLQLLEKEPSDDELRSKIADISSWIGDYEAALEHYRILLNKRKGSVAFRMKVADVFLWSKDYPEAIRLYEEIGINAETDRERYKNLGSAYLGMKKYDNALGIYNELLDMYPEDIEIRADIANALYAAGKIDEAEKEFKYIMKQRPKDVKGMIKIAEILALRQRYEEAIEICNRVLDIEPDNSFAKLWLARITSWNMRYTESLKIYDEIIEKDPKWITPRREKGRVLGCLKQYRNSIIEYKKISDEVQPDEAAEIEMLSKFNFYKRYDASAIEEYKRWLDKEPEDLEALYDLGQVYARQMQWANATATYNQILKIIPSHFRAQQALEKVDIYSKSIHTDSGFELYEADSSGRDIDKKYYNFYTSLRVPLNENLYFTAREDAIYYIFDNPSSDRCQRVSVGAEYFKKPLFWASANYSYNIYSQEGDQHNFNEEVNLRPLDAALFTFSHKHEHVTDNGKVYSDGLEKDDYKIRGRINVNRRLSGGVDYMYTDYDDGNEKETIGADASCVLIYEPTFLKLIYRYEEYGFDEARDSYFTPSSFHYNKLGLEWRHFLNAEELFWGANDTYYTLKYEINLEVHDERGHKFYADFHRDWTDRLSTDVEWSRMIYEHSGTYNEDRFLASVKYDF